MTLHAAFVELDIRFEQLEDALAALMWAVVQAQPESKVGNALVDNYDRTSVDLVSHVKDARLAASAGRAASSGSVDLVKAYEALVVCHDLFNQLWSRFYADSGSQEWNDLLRELRDGGGEWSRWVQGVRDALSRCPAPLYEVAVALFRCWQDLVERASLPPVPVHLANLLPEPRLSPGMGSEGLHAVPRAAEQ